MTRASAPARKSLSFRGSAATEKSAVTTSWPATRCAGQIPRPFGARNDNGLLGEDTKRGFTLIEVAIAVAIVSLAVVAVIGSFSTELRAAERARRALEAQALAEQRLTALTLAPADILDRLPDSLASGRFAPPFDDYAWQAMATTDRRRESLFYELSVTVRWSSGEFSLGTRAYRRRLQAVQ